MLFPSVRSSCLAAGLAAVLLLPATAQAQGQQAQPPVPSTMERMTGMAHASAARDWHGEVGLGVLLRPEYEGSSETEFGVLPLIDLTWRDRVFLALDDQQADTPEGLGLNITRTRNMQTALTLNVDYGRDESDSNELNGLGDIDSSLELGALFNVVNGHWKVHGSIALGVTDGHEGIIADIGFKYGARYGERTVVTFGPYMTIADDSYMESYYGVDAQQAASSGLAQFEAGMDIKDLAFEGRFIHRLSGPWSVNAFGRAVMLFGDASNSPVTREDSFLTAGVALTYDF